MKRWQGLFPPVTTKFNAQDRLDIAEMERCLALQAQAGVHGFIVAAGLGEGHGLDLLERTEVMKAALRIADDRIPVLMAIVSATSREACLLAEASARNGADGLFVLPPIHYRSDVMETEAYYRAIARAGGLPIMICNDLGSSAADVTPELLARLADEPLFRAVCESSGDVRRITRIVNLTGDRYDLFAGIDTLAFESLIMGAKGWVAALAAAFPKEALAIWRHAISGHMEEARRVYRWFQPLLELGGSSKSIQNIKLVESMVVGSTDRCRLPRQPLRGEERLRVEKVVRYALASRAGIHLHSPAAE